MRREVPVERIIRRIFVGAAVLGSWWAAGCRPAEITRYDYAADIRRDAKALLASPAPVTTTTTPASEPAGQ